MPSPGARSKAKVSGDARYWTGKYCKSGHLDWRNTIGGSCVSCNRESKNRRYAMNPKKFAATARKSYAENIDKFRAQASENARKRRAANPEKAREYGRAKYAANKEKMRQRSRDWRKAHPDLRRLYNIKHRARKRSAPGSFSQAEYQTLRQREKYCHICGKRFTKDDPATLDHVVPLKKGGSHDAGNIALAHRSCNSSKNARRTHLI